MKHIITKGMIKPWLRKLIKQGILVAPVELQGGDVVFKELFTPDNILLEYKQPLYSVKTFLLPQEETLFTFDGSNAETIQAVYDEFPRIFFGLRPCDLKAVTQADSFFTENYRDPYYLQRRKQTLLIVIGCSNPEAHCFCHNTGISPYYSEGADIFMMDLGSGFAVEPKTLKGAAAVNEYLYFFDEISEEQQEDIIHEKFAALHKLEWNMPQTGGLPAITAIPDEFWQKTSQKCFSCGSCSYICPLCFCYNVVDRAKKDCPGKRVRTWDACIFEGFTRMAGRHNLLKSRQERLKKRFAHKLQQYPEKYGFPGCTGCGRCTVTCPGNIGMLEIVKKLKSEGSVK